MSSGNDQNLNFRMQKELNFEDSFVENFGIIVYHCGELRKNWR